MLPPFPSIQQKFHSFVDILGGIRETIPTPVHIFVHSWSTPTNKQPFIGRLGWTKTKHKKSIDGCTDGMGKILVRPVLASRSGPNTTTSTWKSRTHNIALIAHLRKMPIEITTYQFPAAMARSLARCTARQPWGSTLAMATSKIVCPYSSVASVQAWPVVLALGTSIPFPTQLHT